MSINVEALEGLGDWFAVDTITSDMKTVLDLTESSSKEKESEKGRKFSAPLKGRHVEAYLNLDAGLSETTETLSFAHPTKDCTANFRFPLPPNAAVRRFTAKVGGRTIRTIVKEKAEADKEYNEAVSQGHTAVRMSQETKQNIFQVSLGNLAAGEEAEISIQYVRLLQRTGGVLEYVHTATWVPPYYSWHDGYFPESLPGKQPAQANKVSYPLTYSITLQDSSNLKKGSAHSSTHTSLAASTAQEALTYTVSEQVCDPSKDFQLAVEMNKAQGHQILMQSAPPTAGSDAPVNTILASFVPDVKKEATPSAKRQIMLVIDGSGSMSGRPIEQASESAELFIRDLPLEEGIMFNIVMFGSSHKYMWKDYKLYNKETENSALLWLKNHCTASYGGTEMLRAVQSVYSTPLKYGYTRSVLLLTDGGVGYGQDQQLHDLVTPKSWDTHMTHVFVLGIGHGVHRPLLDGVAAKSHGVAQYVMDSSEIAKKMGRLSEAALATDCVFEPRLKCRRCMLDLIPTKLPNVIYPGCPLTILATITRAEPGAILEMVGKDSKGAELSYSLALPTSATCQGSSFKTLHAMSKISELTNGSSCLHISPDGEAKTQPPSPGDEKTEIVSLAKAEGLVTQYTSYIGVELRLDPLDPSKVINNEIPIEGPAEWERSERVFRDRRERASSNLFGGAVPGAAFGGMVSKGTKKGVSLGGMPPGAKGRSAGFGFGGSPSGAQPSYGLPQAQSLSFATAAPGAAPPGAAPGYEGGVEGMRGQAKCMMMRASGKIKKASSLFGVAPTQSAPYAGRAQMYETCAPMDVDGEEEEDEDKGFSFGPSGAFGSAPQTSIQHLQGPELVQALSKLRTTEGYWTPSKALYDLVYSKRTDVTDKAAEFTKSAGSQDLEAFATILALAFLDKHAQKERTVWQGMWKKAVKFLEAKVDDQAKSIDRHIMDARINV